MFELGFASRTLRAERTFTVETGDFHFFAIIRLMVALGCYRPKKSSRQIARAQGGVTVPAVYFHSTVSPSANLARTLPPNLASWRLGVSFSFEITQTKPPGSAARPPTTADTALSSH